MTDNTNNIKVKENKKIGEKYYYIKHISGLEIYVIPKEHVNAYAIIGTRYGSSDRVFKTEKDADYISVPDGVAHFLEHKLFEDENGDDSFARFARFGGNANAYTGFNQTCYLFSATENFEENLDILLDFVQKPYFTEKNVQKEQGIIGEEIKMYDDDPNWCVYFNMLRALYFNNPVRINVCGTIESISEITPEILYRCYNTFYNLNNMVLCVCGDVTTEQVLDVADKVLISSNPVEISRLIEDEPDGIKEEKIVEKGEVSMPVFCIGIKNKPSADGADMMRAKAENEIILRMLFGRSSEFYNRSYESGLITPWFYASFNNGRGMAMINISGGAENPDAIFSAVKSEIEKRKTDFFGVEEFERAKKCTYASELTGFNNTASVANNMISFALDGQDYMEYPNIISAVSYDDVKLRFISDYRTENSVLSVIEPQNAE